MECQVCKESYDMNNRSYLTCYACGYPLHSQYRIIGSLIKEPLLECFGYFNRPHYGRRVSDMSYNDSPVFVSNDLTMYIIEGLV